MNKKLFTVALAFILVATLSVSFVFSVENGVSDLRINELVSMPSSGSDWVEIYYSYGTDGVDLSQCKLVDDASNELLLSGTIPSGGFLAFDWSNRLNNGGDTVTLKCNGQIIDVVGYGSKGDAPKPEEGESIGRCLDGEDTNNDADDFEILVPTKGSENDCGEEEPEELVCGNGILEYEEQCDDGNFEDGDGCSQICEIEEEPEPEPPETQQAQNGGSKAGTGIGIDTETEDFEPRVWACGNRLVYDDATEPGRKTLDGEFLKERMNNYAFEGEQIVWDVLVMDKNGKEKIEDVFATIGSSQGAGNDIEVNCQRSSRTRIDNSCNAKILEEDITEFDSDIMRFYECTLTVETPESMQGEYWVTVEAEDLDGLSGTMDENEFWFFNPLIDLSIVGDLEFEGVRPGTSSYSQTLLVRNDAEPDSGVRLDMFISGTDFYDSESSGAMCPTTNQLGLGSFRYYVTNGAYSTQTDGRDDSEGYVPIGYGIGFNDPNPFYDAYEILQSGPKLGPYYMSNILTPGGEMALTFRLNLPEPCNGDFDTGQIYFWGEAI